MKQLIETELQPEATGKYPGHSFWLTGGWSKEAERDFFSG